MAFAIVSLSAVTIGLVMRRERQAPVAGRASIVFDQAENRLPTIK